MALPKQTVDISFAQGIETKVDPFRVPAGKFLSLQNSIFDKAGRLTKRNGYGALASLPDSTYKYLTTFNDNLTAIGTSLSAYSPGSNSWVTKGALYPIDLHTRPLVRSNTAQTQADAVVAPNGLVCVAYSDQNPANLATTLYKYAIYDSTTGQNIVSPTLLTSADPTYGTPRVFLLGNYFIILYTVLAGSYQLKYIAVSMLNPTIVTAPADITTSYIPSTTLSYDATVLDSKLIVAYNTTSGGQAVKVTSIDTTLGPPTAGTAFSGEIATMFTLAIDQSNVTNPVVYVSYYDAASDVGKTLAVNQNLNQVLAPTSFITATNLLNITSTARSGSLSLFYEVESTYGYSSTKSNYIATKSVSSSGTVGSQTVVTRSVGLASKAFLLNSESYFLTVYNSGYQPTYFMTNGSGKIVAKLASTNASGYYTHGLPNYTNLDSVISIPYLIKSLIQAVNKTQGVTNSTGVYAQLGVQLASFNFDVANIQSAEIGNNLNLTGGFLAMYDGVSPVEQGFFVYPEDILATPSTTGGTMTAQQYYYQVTYEWNDNQGNLFRSAPSLPIAAETTGTTGSVTLNIPTLRLTYKIASPVRIVIYRWSAGQQSYYQIIPINTPILNDPTADSVTYVDTAIDSSILGNNIIYTTGGVLENIVAPATSNICLFNNRLFAVDAEDRNLLWYSKQIIEATPVEMSDLLTLYIAPTTASQGSTGDITAISPMDDKLVIFKANALGYVNGIGPDNTGANGQYSDYILINSVNGCTNQQSIVFTPNGLMYQSAKGIWLLGRDLSTNYIGAPVETLTTGATVLSAMNVPGSTQVRFTLDTGITLMYDYFFNQWGTFVNVPALSSTIYKSLHTFINSYGQVFQETPGKYLDNTSPVLMSFTTGWINLAGVQGFERFYQLYLLGQYYSPFKLNMQIAYDYNSSSTQSVVVTPSNATSVWGNSAVWGDGASWGSSQTPSWESTANVFEARVFPQRQKCESFQITAHEVFNSAPGQMAGAGFTLSGMSLIVGAKRGFRTSKASRNFG